MLAAAAAPYQAAARRNEFDDDVFGPKEDVQPACRTARERLPASATMAALASTGPALP
jgi:hypothetical protein